jgi:hypothetical protein
MRAFASGVLPSRPPIYVPLSNDVWCRVRPPRVIQVTLYPFKGPILKDSLPGREPGGTHYKRDSVSSSPT